MLFYFILGGIYPPNHAPDSCWWRSCIVFVYFNIFYNFQQLYLIKMHNIHIRIHLIKQMCPFPRIIILFIKLVVHFILIEKKNRSFKIKRIRYLSNTVAVRSKASCLGPVLWDARWFESSWGKNFFLREFRPCMGPVPTQHREEFGKQILVAWIS